MRLLITVQFHLNNNINRVTKKTPFNIIYRYKPEIRINTASIIKGSSLLKKDTRCSAKEKILLNTKNLRVRKLYKKLTDRYIRPFKITKTVGPNIYQLKLPEQYRRLYKTFHISLLKPYMRRAGEQSPGLISLNKNDRYQVESIRKKRISKDKI